MDLLETLAKRMDCEYLGELRFLSRPNTKLRHIVANTPLTAFSDKEWIGTAEYLCGVKSQSAKDARDAMMLFLHQEPDFSKPGSYFFIKKYCRTNFYLVRQLRESVNEAKSTPISL